MTKLKEKYPFVNKLHYDDILEDVMDTVDNIEVDDVKASNIDSEEATSGQVLTANGNGGASWENASGGSLYRHNIIIDINGSLNNISWSSNNLTITVTSKEQSAFTKANIVTKLYNIYGISDNRLYNCLGTLYDNTNNISYIISAYKIGSGAWLYLCYYRDSDKLLINVPNFNILNNGAYINSINDTVTQIL